jgi:hypothetical protein
VVAIYFDAVRQETLMRWLFVLGLLFGSNR